jgi:hypothetical protein
MLDMGLSKRVFNGVRSATNGRVILPPHSRLAAAIDSATAPVDTMVTAGGMSMVHVTLAASFAADLRADPVLRTRETHHIKIGGDSATDSAEKELKSRSILLLVYSSPRTACWRGL